MDHKSLYLKYRPEKLSSIKGQDAISTTLKNALKNDAVSHAYLLCGPRGTGKTSTARIISRAINCLDPKDGEPCNKCEICKSALEGRLTDIIEIDAASRRRVEETNELIEKIKFLPNQAKNKIYIIDEVHMLSKHAFNALLKTLEEPPAHAYFVLATTEAHKIPETIISRCQRFDFRRIDEDVIKKVLSEITKKEKVDVEEEALRIIARRSNGGLRDAISALDQVISEGKVTAESIIKILGLGSLENLKKLYDFLIKKDCKEALNLVSEIVKGGSDIFEFNKEMMTFLREKMLESVRNNSKELKSILRLIEIFSEASYEISSSAIPQLPLEIAVVRSCFENLEEDFKKNESAKENLNKEESKKKVDKTNKEAKKEKVEKTDISIDEIRKNWGLICKSMKDSASKIALKSGSPAKISDGKVVVIFNSKFHLSKIDSVKSKDEFKNKTKEILGFEIGIEPKLGGIKIEPVDIPNENLDKEEVDVLGSVNEIFGK